MERKQFTFYRSYFEAVSNLPKTAQTAVLLAICEYALDEKEPKLTGAAKAVFSLIRPNLDTSRKRAELGVTYGKGKKEKEKQTDSKPIANAKQTDSEGEKEIEIEIEKEIEIECEYEKDILNQEGRPSAPTLEEVIDYASSEGIPEASARKFFLTYSSIGWLIKGKPMVNWKSRLLLWHDEDKAKETQTGKPYDKQRNAEIIRANMKRAEAMA